MKLRSLFLAALVGFASTFAFAQAPSLNPADTTSLQQAIAAKDAKAIAQLAANNPTQAAAIARAAATGAPDQAAVFTAAVITAVGDASAPAIAKAVVTALPGQAATIAAAAAKAIDGSGATLGAMTKAVVEAVPAQAASVAVAVLSALGPTTGDRYNSAAVQIVTRSAIDGIPEADRTMATAAVVGAAVAKVVPEAQFNTVATGVARAMSTGGTVAADAMRGADATAANNAFTAGRAAGTAGSAAGNTGTTVGGGINAGDRVVVNSPSGNNGNVDAGQIVSGSGT